MIKKKKIKRIQPNFSITEVAYVLDETRRGAVMECLSIIKGGYLSYEDFRNNPQVQIIVKLYCINLMHIL